MRTRWMVVLGAALALLLGLSHQAIAQESAATPETHGEHAAADAGHPAHIHMGTCDTVGDVMFPLENLTEGGNAATPVAASDGEHSASSTTTVEAALDDIIAGGHVVNVHESVENIQNYIACGEVTGEPTDGELTVDLEALNDSGYSGTATLTDNGDGTTTVVVTVSGPAAGTPEASPAA